ncbi:Protein of unknown function [Cotesia congregata]|uniref:Uncharacterized protein n=1 Tax=Cotesia congregata TaxID=51543 RepID=A0A8J2H913_COTCN|nr:Protein of unknown function [Cotesia congregata]
MAAAQDKIIPLSIDFNQFVDLKFWTTWMDIDDGFYITIHKPADSPVITFSSTLQTLSFVNSYTIDIITHELNITTFHPCGPTNVLNPGLEHVHNMISPPGGSVFSYS